MHEDDMVLADLRLPDGDGIALLEDLRKQGRNNPYIIMTDYDEVPTAVRSMKLGAEDYIQKRLLADNLPPLLRTLQKRLERHETSAHERTSPVFRNIYDRIRLVAPTNMSVLILGESGTGKEHIAERIHSLSKRSGKPFVSVDCGLLSKELAASVLFGHEKGAFTGADTKREGYWEEADGGTLFLDEIGIDFPDNCQPGDYLLKIRVYNENKECYYTIHQWFEAYISHQVSSRDRPIPVGPAWSLDYKAPSSEDDIFDIVQNMPEFPGGMPGLMEFIHRNIRYPQAAKQSRLEGRIIVQVIIDKDGTVTQPIILRSINPVLSVDTAFCEEALRIVSIMPKWKPGNQHGVNLKVRFTFPIKFESPTD